MAEAELVYVVSPPFAGSQKLAAGGGIWCWVEHQRHPQNNKGLCSPPQSQVLAEELACNYISQLPLHMDPSPCLAKGK